MNVSTINHEKILSYVGIHIHFCHEETFVRYILIYRANKVHPVGNNLVGWVYPLKPAFDTE